MSDEIRNGFEKFYELTKSGDFVKYEKDLADKLVNTIRNSYTGKEPEIVESIANNLNGKLPYGNMSVSTNGIFIHGNKTSGVRFQYGGGKVERELGDLIYVFSVIYKNKKILEKASFSQFKKGGNSSSWNLSNREQLYLLSRFPTFCGIPGSIVPTTEISLQNYSGSLGTYDLLYEPGDFIHVNAPLLDTILSNHKSLRRKEFSLLEKNRGVYFEITCSLVYEELLHFYLPFYKYSLGGCAPFCASAFSANAHHFIQEYLRGCVGETIFGIGIDYDKESLKLIRDIFRNLKERGKKISDASLESFADSFLNIPYAIDNKDESQGRDFNGDGGIAIIYTKVDLGDGK
jgi:hypothetical protein